MLKALGTVAMLFLIMKMYEMYVIFQLLKEPSFSLPVKKEVAHLQHYKRGAHSLKKVFKEVNLTDNVKEDTIMKYKDNVLPRIQNVLTILGLPVDYGVQLI